jgi:hypothetical protein
MRSGETVTPRMAFLRSQEFYPAAFGVYTGPLNEFQTVMDAKGRFWLCTLGQVPYFITDEDNHYKMWMIPLYGPCRNKEDLLDWQG